jgi:lysozyme
MSLRGCDISAWQGKPDFDKVKSQVKFVICKVSEGTDWTDDTFKRNREECARVGLIFGGYHFARPSKGNTSKAEAKSFLGAFSELVEGDLLALDYEDAYSGDVVKWCKEWLDEVYAQTKVKPLIYLNQSHLKLNWKPVIDAGYGLWLAVYDPTPVPNTAWPVVAIQQNSSSGTITGITGKVDTDIFFGDAKALKSYGYKKTAEPCADQEDAIKELQQELIDMRASRDKWKAEYGEAKDQLEGQGVLLNAQEEHITTLTTDNNELKIKLAAKLKEISWSDFITAKFGR